MSRVVALHDSTPRPRLRGSSPALRTAIEPALRFADRDGPILIRGESGTGRRHLARHIHARSRRADKPFEVVVLAGIRSPGMEMELFGEGRAGKRGRARRRGRLEQAADGTLFVSEVGRAPSAVIDRLERVFVTGRIEPADGDAVILVEARVIASAKEAAGTRRGGRLDDVFGRFGVVVELPPLRDRRDDRLLLARHFLEHYARLHRRPIPRLSREAVALIRSHPWPGNVRELRHAMERAVLLADGKKVYAADIVGDGRVR